MNFLSFVIEENQTNRLQTSQLVVNLIIYSENKYNTTITDDNVLAIMKDFFSRMPFKFIEYAGRYKMTEVL